MALSTPFSFMRPRGAEEPLRIPRGNSMRCVVNHELAEAVKTAKEAERVAAMAKEAVRLCEVKTDD